MDPVVKQILERLHQCAELVEEVDSYTEREWVRVAVENAIDKVAELPMTKPRRKGVVQP